MARAIIPKDSKGGFMARGHNPERFEGRLYGPGHGSGWSPADLTDRDRP